MLEDTTPHVSFHVEKLSFLVLLFSSHVKKIGIPFIRKSKLGITVLALSSLLFIWDLPGEKRHSWLSLAVQAWSLWVESMAFYLRWVGINSIRRSISQPISS